MNIRLRHAIGRGYESYWHCKKRYRVNKGGRASKKSRTAALWYIYHLMKFYHVYNTLPCLLVIRKFLNTHRNSTRSELIWAINRLGVSHLWHIPKGELTLTYKPSGQVILFRGLDEPDSLTSISVPKGHLCWCWIEEFYQIHNENDFNKLDLSFRGEIPDPLFKSITGSMNPWNDLWWGKARFFDTDDTDVFTLTTTYLCNEFLGIDDLKVFNKMKKNSPRRYKVEGLGAWGNCEGLIYIGYVENPELNHIEKIPEKLYRLSLRLDYGSGSQDSKLGKTVITAAGITENYEKVYAITESYFYGHFIPDQVIKRVIKFILDLQEKYPDVHTTLHCEWASSSIINNALKLAVKEQGIDVEIESAYKSTILDRVELCQILLS